MPIKVMGLCPGVRMWHVDVWVSIIWLASAVSVSALGEIVSLQAVPQVVSKCGEQLTLTCEANSSQWLQIKTFSWLFNGQEYQPGKPHAEILCKRADKPPQHSLTLTILNVMPVNQGVYICKLRSNLGVKATNTTVRVQDCLGAVNSSIDNARPKCCFNGVYPIGFVHWFQGTVNYTSDAAMSRLYMEQSGRYNICSSLDVKKSSSSEPYNCSLWIPSTNKYLLRKQVPVVMALDSSGSLSALQGILLVVQFMTVMYLT